VALKPRGRSSFPRLVCTLEIRLELEHLLQLLPCRLSISITCPATDADFVPALMVDSYLPGTIGIANAGWSR
jgi:hypothetical protein